MGAHLVLEGEEGAGEVENLGCRDSMRGLETLCGAGEAPASRHELVRGLDAKAPNLGGVVAAGQAAEELELVVFPAGEGGAVVVPEVPAVKESAGTLTSEFEELFSTETRYKES